MRRKNWIITCSIAAFLAASLLAISSTSLYSGYNSFCTRDKKEKCTKKSNNPVELLQDNLSNQFILFTPGLFIFLQ